MKIKLGWKTVVGIVVVVSTVVVACMTMGINEAGYRQVVQYPNGTVFVKFTPGPYLKLFGSATQYPDVMTVDFDANDAESTASIDVPGILVRYRDGGTGNIYGKGRFNLPDDSETMITLHKEARGTNGVAHKVIMATLSESLTLTAGLMTSEEGYDAKRAIFTQWAKSQLVNGPFITESKTISIKDEASGKTIYKQVASIKETDTGAPMHYTADLKKYGITVSSFQLGNPSFEKKTMDQIDKKRAATMAIITAKADAEKAKQDAITAEEKGKASVMTARYEEEVKKERSIVEAQRVKEVAEINAKRKVEVAKQALLEAEQMKLTAKEVKAANILEGEGLAEKKRLIIEADGALEQKLAAVVEINRIYAIEFGKQKWVPEIQMGATEGGNGADALINLLTANAAKAVNVDLSVK